MSPLWGQALRLQKIKDKAPPKDALRRVERASTLRSERSSAEQLEILGVELGPGATALPETVESRGGAVSHVLAVFPAPSVSTSNADGGTTDSILWPY